MSGRERGPVLVAWLAAVSLLIATPGGVVGEESPAAKRATTASVLVPQETGADEFPGPVLEALQTALDAYEEARAELAADRLEGVPAAAVRLAGVLDRTLDEGGGELGEPIPGVIDGAASSARAMAAAADLEAARIAFADLSRSLMILANHDRRLAAGWHVFVCPMAGSFGKWIQPDEKIENPYMGPAMLACGGPSDWSLPKPSSAADKEPAAGPAASADQPGAAAPEPEFRPGIPGMQMEDVRDYKHLWREIEELQIWERGDRISVAEYRSKVIEKTAHFLRLGGAEAAEFTATATDAVGSIRDSLRRGPPIGEDPGSVQSTFSADLRAATARLTSLLGEEPRQQLFVPDGKKWLLKLAFGPGEAKEAREAGRARAGISSESPGGVESNC